MLIKDKGCPVEVGPSIWRYTFGEPEAMTPYRQHPVLESSERLTFLPAVESVPFEAGDVSCRVADRGCVLELPMEDGEQVYGLGLHLPCFTMTNRRARMCVNDEQHCTDGTSHAPVPFYVSTRGYGVLVDTFRNAQFFAGNLVKVDGRGPGDSGEAGGIAVSTEDLYASRSSAGPSMTVEVPVAEGVDVYILGGPTLRDAVCRYNLLAGGGCIPALWGLGPYYRTFGRFSAEEVLDLALYLRKKQIPCSVLGLEPGWHSHAYSCSYVWSPERFPEPQQLVDNLKALDFEVNLWEHAFVHPDAPFHDTIAPYCGDYEVWGGLVPDFTLHEARDTFADHHRQELVAMGISSFKLDECDHQPHSGTPWSFPDFTRFPSGMDGEQMHSAFGLVYQQAINETFLERGLRTYGQTRASHALASSLPFVLYSDAYNHRDYVRGLLNAGFCGLLWQPEVRNADSEEDLCRRIATAALSPQTIVNAWFIPHPPWLQIDEEKNRNHELLADPSLLEDIVRNFFALRMRLAPWLYSAFVRYYKTGLPPFRALVMDYPDDRRTHAIDDAYLMGDNLLVAPLFGNEQERDVYLPGGDWYCFWTHQRYAGGAAHSVAMPLERIPLFVKAGSLLPLAEPMQTITEESCFDMTVWAFGDAPAACTLYEDDGVSYDFANGLQNKLLLSWDQEAGGSVLREGGYPRNRYRIQAWRRAGEADGV